MPRRARSVYSLLAARLLNRVILSMPQNEATFRGRDKPFGHR